MVVEANEGIAERLPARCGDTGARQQTQADGEHAAA
jgi:hypothetical protein